MPTVWQRSLSGESRLHLREMIDQVIGDAAYGFVGRAVRKFALAPS